VRCLLADRAGHLWIAYAGETVLQRMTEGKFQNYDLPAGSKAVRALVEDAAGQVWMANLDAQLLRVEGDRVVEVTPPAGGAPRPIRSLAGAPDGSIWIGYSAAGVGRLKAGKFSLIGAPHGLPDESICSLMPDERGWFWFGSDHGIFRVSQDELAAVADGHLAAVRAVGYGAEDGLPSLQGYYGYSPGAARTRDGRILFPTHSGLAIVHPSRVRTNLVAPPVIIESVKVDGEEMLRGGEPEKLRLSPGYKKLEVTFTAPSFIEPEKVRFSHRLKGWDEDWSEAGVERGVSYSRLPAGQYGFAVKAGNNAGVWNEQGRELASLRVLGFTNREVSGVLFAELATVVLLAQPIGWLIGYGISLAMVAAFSSDLYRVPFVIGREVFATASLVVLAAALVSAFAIRGRINNLDMIEVLKTRE